jgi:hypothetical protein
VTTQSALFIISILAARYVYIFCLKNPAAFKDEFWSLFCNVIIVIISWTSQLVTFAMTAGRQAQSY